MLSQAQMRDAYHEAEQILRLDEKWQELMPGSKKPNFRRAAREILQRALGHTVDRRQTELDVHSGLMHEHEPREAELIERTLKTGLYHPRVLHNFQHGEPESKDELPKEYEMEHDPDLPDIDVFLHDHSSTIEYPSHYEPGTGTFHSSVHVTPTHEEVPLKVPQGTTMPSEYEAVH